MDPLTGAITATIVLFLAAWPASILVWVVCMAISNVADSDKTTVFWFVFGWLLAWATFAFMMVQSVLQLVRVIELVQ